MLRCAKANISRKQQWWVEADTSGFVFNIISFHPSIITGISLVITGFTNWVLRKELKMGSVLATILLPARKVTFSKVFKYDTLEKRFALKYTDSMRL